jgi:hypothetical protein
LDHEAFGIYAGQIEPTYDVHVDGRTDDVLAAASEFGRRHAQEMVLIAKKIREGESDPNERIGLTPKAEERIRHLDATIARLKQQRTPGPVSEGQQQVCAKVQDVATAPPLSTATDVPPAEQPSVSGQESQ